MHRIRVKAKTAKKESPASKKIAKADASKHSPPPFAVVGLTDQGLKNFTLYLQGASL